MLRDGLTGLEVRIDELLAEGSKVAVATTLTGRHDGELFGLPPTGRRVSIAGVDIVRIERGKIVEHRGLTDLVGLMRQLGADGIAGAHPERPRRPSDPA
jgi:predicted ester cyclase